jgi:hypothetical protein
MRCGWITCDECTLKSSKQWPAAGKPAFFIVPLKTKSAIPKYPQSV